MVPNRAKYHIFALRSVFYACMFYTVSYKRISSIFVLSHVLADLNFFKITSDYLISGFPWSSSGETTAYLENSTLTKPSIFFYSF